MRTPVLHINDCNSNKLGMLAQQSRSTNRESIDRMRSILTHAINGELTELQRYCLTERYINGRKQKDIADDLGVNASTVCRHIAVAEKKLRTIAGYYQ